MSEQGQHWDVWKRTGGNFAVFAVCAFVLFLWAAAINWLAQLVGLSSPEKLTRVVTSIGNSATLQAIISIWLLTASVAIAFPRVWKPLSATTALMFDIGYGVLGALAGFGVVIGLFTGNWWVLLWSLIYSALIAIGYFAVRRWLPLADLHSYGRMRWIVAGVLFVAAPIILIWG